MYSSLQSQLRVLDTHYPPHLKPSSCMSLPPMRRDDKILRPQDNIYSTNSNNVVRFNFPKENCDFRTGFLAMNVKLDGIGGTYIRLPNGAWNIFDRARVVLGAYEEEIQYLNRLESLLYTTSLSHEVRESIGVDLLGEETPGQRNVYGASTDGTEYIIVIRAGILQSQILPLELLCTPENGQNMFVELTLANPLSCLETDKTNPQITLTNIRWNYFKVSSSDGVWESTIKSKISMGEFKFGYDCWSVYQNAVLNSANDLQIPWRGSALNGIITTIVDGLSLNNPLVDDKMFTWLKQLSNGAKPLQFTHNVNHEWIPQEQVVTDDNAYRAYMLYLNLRGLWDSRVKMLLPAPIALDDFNDKQFMIIGDFYPVAHDAVQMHAGNEVLFNPLSTVNQSHNTILRLTYDNPPPAQTVAYHFIHHSVCVSVNSSGRLMKLL